eukprot:7044323-Karenia_brevis.AAC.1
MYVRDPVALFSMYDPSGSSSPLNTTLCPFFVCHSTDTAKCLRDRADLKPHAGFNPFLGHRTDDLLTQ